MQTPWGDCAVADAHVHFFSRLFFEALAAQAGKTAATTADALGWELPGPDPTELAGRWASELSVEGVTRVALIASLPGDEASVIAAKTAFPGMFLAYAMINPTAKSPPVVEKLDALCFFPAMHRYSMHDARVQPILEQAAAQNSLIFVHCGVLTVGVRKKLGLPSPFDMSFSNPIDLHAIALRYPQLNFVLPHFGAGYFREALMLADLCPNVYLDTSSSNAWTKYEGLDLKTVFRRALDVVGSGRLLFGTDSSFFPRGWNYEIFELQSRVLFELGVGSGDARRILGENLLSLSGDRVIVPADGR
jgi:hypothetical protein